MNILQELHLADVQLKKSIIQRVIIFTLLVTFIVFAEWFFYWYVCQAITVDYSTPTGYSPYQVAYYKKIDDDNYTCFIRISGKWKRYTHMSERSMAGVQSAFDTANHSDLLVNKIASPFDIGLINGVHKAVYMVVLGGGMALVLEPALRRRQNRREVLTFCEMYHMDENSENFDQGTLETISEYQKLCRSKNLTQQEKMNKLFLSERLVLPEKAKAREKKFAIQSLKAKRRAELEAIKEDNLIQQERLERVKQEKIEKERNENNARVKREKAKKNNAKQAYLDERKRLDEIMLVAKNDNLPQIKPDMTPDEIAEVKRLQQEEKVRINEKRQLIRHMRKQSSFMK